MSSLRFHAAWEIALVVGAPLMLAAVELVHPHPNDLLQLDVRTWLTVHYAQIPLFPLSALAVAALVRNHADIAAAACRVAMFVFAASYIAFDTAAGVCPAFSSMPRKNRATRRRGALPSTRSGAIPS